MSELTVKGYVLEIKEWGNYLLSKWKLLMLFALLFSSIGFVIGFTSKVNYVATVSFVVEGEKGGGMGGALGIASQFGFDFGGAVTGSGIFEGENLIALMKSKTLILKTLVTPINVAGKKITLADFYVDQFNLRESWTQKVGSLKPFSMKLGNENELKTQQDSLLNVLYKIIVRDHLYIGQRDKKLSIIDAVCKSPNELFSKAFIETLVTVVSDFYAVTKTQKSLLNVSILEKQADSIRIQLNNALAGVASTNDATFNLNSALTIPRVSSQKKQIDIQINSAILTEILKNLEISRIALRKETPLIQIVDIPTYPLEKEKLSTRISVIFGFVIGLFAGIGFFVIKKIWQKLETSSNHK